MPAPTLFGPVIRLTIAGLYLSPFLFSENAASSKLSIVDPAKTGSLAFTWRQAVDGAAVFAVYNDGEQEQPLIADVSELIPVQSGTGKGSASLKIAISPLSGTIKPHSAVQFQLTVPPDRPLAAKYAGTVLFRKAAKGDPVLASNVVLTVPGPELPITKAVVTLLRYTPFGPWKQQTFPVPLFDPAALHGLEGRAAGAVSRDNGGWAIVKWGSDSTQPAFIIEDPPAAGKYVGDLSLAPDAAKPALNLIVIARDMVIWPLLVIVLGILLAYLLKRYIGVLRITWSLRLQEAELGDAFRQAQALFDETAQGQLFRSYSIAKSVANERKSMLDKLSEVEKSPMTTLDATKPPYKDALDKLAAIQNAIALWPRVAQSLAGLAAVLNDARAGLPNNPELIAQAQTLLMGKEITIDELSDLNQQAATLASQITAGTTPVLAQMDPALFAAPTEAHRPAAGDQRRAQILHWRITRSDTWATLFAATLAILTGLNQYYFGNKPFGNFADYVSVFLWAAGTKAALDIILAVVDRFTTINAKV